MKRQTGDALVDRKLKRENTFNLIHVKERMTEHQVALTGGFDRKNKHRQL